MTLRPMILLLTLLAGISWSESPPEEAILLQSARGAASALGQSLKGRLLAAVEQGGLTGAVSVCRNEAPVLAGKVSAEHALIVRRTSLKARNPANLPDAWEQAALEHLATQIGNGTAPAEAEVFEQMQSTSGETVFRYARAIVIEPLCLNCHGPSLAPDLDHAVAELYPEDTATGYDIGDLRGAFSVMIPLEP